MIGAGALAVYGVSRSTLDFDLLVTAPRALDRAVWHQVGASVEIRVGDDDDPLAGVVRISAVGEREVDVVVGRHRWQLELVESAAPVNHPAGTIPVVAPAGLVLLKLYAGGPQDLWDVQQLRAAVGPSLDTTVDSLMDRLPHEAQEAWRTLTRA
jgi:hypothetical protein